MKTSLIFAATNPRRAIEKSVGSLEANTSLLTECTKQLGGWVDFDKVDRFMTDSLKDKFNFVLQLFEIYPDDPLAAPRLIKEFHRDDHPLSLSIFFMAAREQAAKHQSRDVMPKR